MARSKAVLLDREVESDVMLGPLSRDGDKVRDLCYVRDSAGHERLNYSFRAKPLFVMPTPHTTPHSPTDAERLEKDRSVSRRTLGVTISKARPEASNSALCPRCACVRSYKGDTYEVCCDCGKVYLPKSNPTPPIGDRMAMRKAMPAKRTAKRPTVAKKSAPAMPAPSATESEIARLRAENAVLKEIDRLKTENARLKSRNSRVSYC